MIFDFFTNFFTNLLDWVLGLFPEFEININVPDSLLIGFGIVNYYFNLSPILVLVGIGLGLFFGFLIFKLVIYIWRLLPLT